MSAASKAKNAGRYGGGWRKLRARILAESTICWLCGHSGADSVDHVIPRSLAPELATAIENLRPAHHHPCPSCGRRCNTQKGNRPVTRTVVASRQW